MALCRLCGVVDTYGGDVCAECQPRGDRLAVKVTGVQLRRLRAMSDNTRLTVSDIIRAAIDEFLDERERNVSQTQDFDA